MRIVEAQPAIKRSYPRCDYRKRRNRLAALKKKPRRAWEACRLMSHVELPYLVYTSNRRPAG